MYGPDMTGLFRFIVIVFIIGVLAVGYIAITKLQKWTKDYVTVESKYKPIIDYRLTTNGKHVDTVFIYKFPKK